ncbi:MAG: L,D-transpeptidase family protein [Thermodesulfobacteriota bacterium]|nr:L,D-transpeptidase family protein [Thermodesulfobacteriota bacterium]
MKKCLPLLMILGVLTSCFLPDRTVSAAGYQDALVETLKKGPSTALNLNTHGRKAADIDIKLSELYHGHNLEPFWIENGKCDIRGSQILSVLTDAGSHGLDPADYFVKKIGHFWNKTDTVSLVRLDVLLTLGMMRYVADQQEGRIQPYQIDPELFAAASDIEVDWNVLMKAAFNAPDMKTFLEQQAPPFIQYRALQKKLADYRIIAAIGGWPSIPTGEVLKPGMTDQRIRTLRKRLAVTADLSAADIDSSEFDPALEEAVKKFQKRHHLGSDGVVGKQTLDAMNIPVGTRIQQIIINMERYRWLKRSIMDDRLVAVNIAGFEAVAGRPGNFDVRTPVIVGKPYHKTPVFNDTIKHVVFNPFWTLTPSIARNETLPELKKDPLYLEKNDMRLFQGWDADSPELDPAAIDWSQVSKQNMNKYRVRQDPGPNNALGTLKIIFPNKYHVYLHDTPAHSLFKQKKRAFSHGCIRMARPAEMAAWVLGGEKNGWDLARIKKIIAERKRHIEVLDQPVPIYILYRTTYVNPGDETLYFHEDIYGRDKLLASALFAPNR